MNKILIVLIGVLIFYTVQSQEEFDSLVLEFENSTVEIFGSTRIVNSHSVETLNKGILEFRIEHKFGDIAGTNGGIQTFFGFDNSTDIRFAFEYGVTDDLMLGLGRSKGTAGLSSEGSPYKSLLDGFVKYRLIKQSNAIPVSATIVGSTFYTYMKANTDLTSVASFPKYSNRFAYSTQLNLAKMFGSKLSVSLMPTFVYRNFVASNDVNALFALGGALRYAINPRWGIIIEYFHNLNGNDIRTSTLNSLGVAVEWSTFGHVFTLNLTNATGFGDVQYIPYTYQNWLDGAFRLGFCISRKYVKE